MTTQEVKRKLAAILSADVKGYSRLMGADEEGTLRTLTAYRETMAETYPRPPRSGSQCTWGCLACRV